MIKILYLNPKSSFDIFFKNESVEKINKIAQIEFLNKNDEIPPQEKLNTFDILMGAWGSPMLPANYKASKNQLYLMVTGTVAQQVKLEHLENGLRLSNWGDAISHTIAESAFMQILLSLRGAGAHFQKTHVEKLWVTEDTDTTLQTLFRKNVGLLGFGAIAQKLVPLLKPFDTQISFYDPYVTVATLEKFPNLKQASSVRELFSNNHIISNHSANIPETNNLINAEMLALMPENGVIVNTARGNSLDEEALANEHRNGRLWSSLDVYKKEPAAENNPLRNETRCFMMCHQAGPTLDCYELMGERATENIYRYTNNDTILGEISTEQLQRMT